MVELPVMAKSYNKNVCSLCANCAFMCLTLCMLTPTGNTSSDSQQGIAVIAAAFLLLALYNLFICTPTACSLIVIPLCSARF